MKAGMLVIALIVMGIAQIGQVRAGNTNLQAGNRPPLDEMGQEILKATVQILMFVPRPDKTYRLARGIGTLQLSQGHVWLLTNNHWDEALLQAEVIEFRDSEYHLLAVIRPEVFRAMIRYQDEGSMHLKLTPDLQSQLLPAESNLDILLTLDESGELEVEPGDIVRIAHQQPGATQYISVREARIEALSQYEGVPMMWLVTLDGLPILQGDSGGGVWLDGRLVGNLWATVYKHETMTLTSRGFAAVIPAYDDGASSYYMVDSALEVLPQVP